MDFKELSFSKGHIIFINGLLNIQVIKTLKNDGLMVVLQKNQVTNSGIDV